MDYADIAIKLIIARVDAYLADMGKRRTAGTYPALDEAVRGLTDDALKEWALVSGGKGEGGSYEGAAGRYVRALELMGGNTILQTLMELSLAEFIYPEFSAYLEAGFDLGPCLHMAALIEGRDRLSNTEARELAEKARRLLILDMRSEPLQYAPVRADGRLAGYLEGSDDTGTLLSDMAVLYTSDDESLHEPFANEALIRQGASHFRSGGRVLALTGRGGRRFIARHIAKDLGRSFLFLNIADLIRRADKDDPTPLRDALIRETYYLDAGVCLYGFDDRFIMGGSTDRERGRRDMERLSGMLFKPLTDEGIPLILCVDETAMLPDRRYTDGMRCVSLPERYGFDDRKRLWQGLFKLHGLGLDAASFASRYRMSPKEASLAVAAYMDELQPEGEDVSGKEIKGKRKGADGDRPGSVSAGSLEEESFARISIENIRKSDTGPGRIVYSDIRLEDVKLKSNVKMVLEDALNAVLSGPVALDEWGLRKNYPYGSGVSLLMAGPPGTGKTMSANAIAGELSLPLYQVNLSNTVDKYIGETEKNLEKAFSFAEKNNAILFFDEADALFGTRSEVRDAKDRYANTEISYLLQRMEAYDGIVVMTTNLKGNIDTAFMRRIRFVAHFEHPDEEMRRAIWESCITARLPHGEIDTEYLASQFDKFTGSVIKTVFLNACVRAAGTKEELSMKHLIYAIKQETEKESPVGFSMDTLGKYAYLL